MSSDLWKKRGMCFIITCVMKFSKTVHTYFLQCDTYVYIHIYSKKDPGALSKVVPILRYTMTDENVNILKRVLICVNQLYRLTLEVCRDLYNRMCVTISGLVLIVPADAQVIQ